MNDQLKNREQPGTEAQKAERPEALQAQQTMPVAENSSESAIMTELLQMPAVSEHAIQLDDVKKKEVMADYPGFDPNIHEVDKNGVPIKTPKTGKFKRKEKPRVRNRQPQPVNSQIGVSQSPGQQSIPGMGEPNIEAQAKATAEVVTIIISQIGNAIDRDEWAFREISPGYSEKDMLEDAFTRYFIATGNINVPPWLGLSIAMTSYVAPRLSQKNTSTKLEHIKVWLKGKFKKKPKQEVEKIEK